MTAFSKRLIRISTTVAIALLLVGIILYPKVKDASNSDSKVKVPGRMAMRGGGGQPLFANGFIIVPTSMSELISTTGSLLPDEEVDLSFETSGKVVAIYFEEGTKVKKGDLLAKINDAPLQAQLQKLQAQRKLAEEKLFRQKQLLERDAISRESYDQVSTELQAIEADIMLIKARIAETELRAPFDGIVGLRLISEGAYTSTQTPIAHLVKVSPLKIEFSIPERYAGEVTPGYDISFVIDGIESKFTGKVYAVAPKVDMATRAIVVRAMYPNPNEELKPGRYASITLQLSKIENAVSIPTEALIPEMEGEKVFIYRNGKAEQVRVTTGLRTESRIQVRTGLNFGDTLLTSAILQLRQGIPVQLDTIITNAINLQ